MADNLPSWLDALVSGGIVTLLLGWLGVRQVARIDKLEDGKANASDVKELLRELKIERAAADQSRAELHEKVNGIALIVARLEGRRGR